MTSTFKAEHQIVRVDELDGLRGLLSLWVALAHVFCWTGFWDSVTGPRLLTSSWAGFVEAGAAVDTFIILSGFAISFLIARRQESYGHFIRGRFFRIYPVYLVCLTLGTVAAIFWTPYVLNTAAWRDATVYFEWNRNLSLSETSATAQHAFWHLTLLHGAVPKSVLSDSTGTLLGPAWSVSLEWQYYLVAPLLARVVRSGAGVLFLVALNWLCFRFYSTGNPNHAFLLHQLPLFLIGIGSFHLYEAFAASRRERSSLNTIPVAVVLSLAFMTRWHAVALTLWALAFGCVFAQGDDLFSRVLSSIRILLRHRWLQRLGQISYPLYLVHWPMIIGFLAVILHWNPQVSSGDALMLLMFLGLPLILLAAVMLHVGIERPLMNWGRRMNARS